MNHPEKTAGKRVKLGLAAALTVILAVLFYISGKSLEAQQKQTIYMRCTPIELAGAKSYDIIKKQMVSSTRKTVINRCESDEAVCFHSFDQGGLLSCLKK